MQVKLVVAILSLYITKVKVYDIAVQKSCQKHPAEDVCCDA